MSEYWNFHVLPITFISYQQQLIQAGVNSLQLFSGSKASELI